MSSDAKMTRRLILAGAGATTATTVGAFTLLPKPPRPKFPVAGQVTELTFSVNSKPESQ